MFSVAIVLADEYATVPVPDATLVSPVITEPSAAIVCAIDAASTPTFTFVIVCDHETSVPSSEIAMKA